MPKSTKKSIQCIYMSLFLWIGYGEQVVAHYDPPPPPTAILSGGGGINPFPPPPPMALSQVGKYDVAYSVSGYFFFGQSDFLKISPSHFGHSASYNEPYNEVYCDQTIFYRKIQQIRPFSRTLGSISENNPRKMH